jgi:hypothetical protein
MDIQLPKSEMGRILAARANDRRKQLRRLAATSVEDDQRHSAADRRVASDRRACLSEVVGEPPETQ